MNDDTSTRSPARRSARSTSATALDQRRHRAEAELVRLELDVDQQVGTAGLERLLEGRDRAPARELHLAQARRTAGRRSARAAPRGARDRRRGTPPPRRSPHSSTSSSTPSAPSARARANAATVFSVSRALAPRCPRTSGRGVAPASSRRAHTRKAYHPARRRIKLEPMSRRAPSAVAGALALGLRGRRRGHRRRRLRCAHTSEPPPVGPGRALAGRGRRASARIAYEDDFLEARLRLPGAAGGRARSGSRCARSCSTTCSIRCSRSSRTTSGARRASSRATTSTTSVFESFRDALALFDPARALEPAGPRDPPEERACCGRRPRLVIALFSPRGGDEQVTLALAALATLAPDAGTTGRSGSIRCCTGPTRRALLGDRGGMRRSASAVDALESALGDWPAPVVVLRLDALYIERQQRFSSVLRRPPAGDARAPRARRAAARARRRDAAGGHQHGRRLPARGPDRRGGRADRAAWPATPATIPSCAPCSSPPPSPTPRAADYPGARAPVPAAGRASSAAPPPTPPIRWWRSGCSRPGLARHPADPDLLILSGHVARLLSSYFLAIRRLEEAEAVLERNPAARELQAKISAELIELYFLRLRLRLDPERDAPAFAEADDPPAALRRDHAQRFASTEHEGARRRHRLRAGAQLRQRRPDRSRRAAVPARARARASRRPR